MKTRFRSVSVAGAIAGLIVASVAGIPPAFAGAPTCWGRPATIVGTAGDDRLVGTRGPDVIVGLGGDDFILGKGGDDRACGGLGNDYLAGGRGDDRLETGPGNNAVSGDEGNDVLQGGPGPDDNANYLDAPGPVHANIAQGVATGQGRDILMAGIDELFGSPFDDVLIGDGRGQLLVGLGGDDTLRSGGGWDLLAGGAGDDLIDGGGGVGDWLDDLEFGGRIGRKPVHLDLAEGVETGHGTDTLLRIEGNWEARPTTCLSATTARTG
jgi:hemolysin type calcium-binding protein